LNIELINTGSELMLGFVLNTHQQWLCQQLAGLGYIVTRQVAIADTSEMIQQAVREALLRSDLIIATGGLGPTADDMTRTVIAELLGKQLSEDAEVLAGIEAFFAARKRPMPPNTRVQAQVPEGATVLHNAHGTAPGLILEINPGQFRSTDRRRLLIMLPGPPRELRPMFTKQVVPVLQAKFPLNAPFVCRVLKTTGLGESLVEQKIAPPLRHLIERGLDLGYCARNGEVDVRVTARGDLAVALVDEASQIIQDLIGKHVFGLDEDRLETVVVQLLTEQKKTVALAESCTGGYISHRLTNVPGASVVFLSGMVTYSNEAKQQFVNVRPETLAAHGAVSEPTAREMAEGVRARTGADFGLAVTGIAGPAGGTDQKPIGTVFIALAGPRSTIALRCLNPYDRETFKQITSQQALELLRRTLVE
jgi:nicotinamide-nucleotide amidase